MKRLFIWWFIAFGTFHSLGTQMGPFATQEDCNEIKSELAKQGRVWVSRCWEVK